MGQRLTAAKLARASAATTAAENLAALKEPILAVQVQQMAQGAEVSYPLLCRADYEGDSGGPGWQLHCVQPHARRKDQTLLHEARARRFAAPGMTRSCERTISPPKSTVCCSLESRRRILTHCVPSSSSAQTVLGRDCNSHRSARYECDFILADKLAGSIALVLEMGPNAHDVGYRFPPRKCQYRASASTTTRLLILPRRLSKLHTRPPRRAATTRRASRWRRTRTGS